MARFDVYRPPGGDLLLDVQSDHLDHLPTRVVVPLLNLPSLGELTPEFDVNGERVLMMTQYLTAISRHELRQPVANLAPQRDSITRALDLLLTGF